MNTNLELETAKLVVSNTLVCGKTLFPETFTLPFSPSHLRVGKILDDPTQQKVAIAAWRGFGKSKLVQLAKPVKEILGRQANFIVPISCTATQAEKQAKNLRYKFETSHIIKKMFPNIKGEYWTNDGFTLNNGGAGGLGTLVMPRSTGQQIRGLTHGDFRPDLLMPDDLEDPLHINSAEYRQQVKEYLFSDVLGSVDGGSKKWRCIYIGTVLHDDSLLSNLLEDDDWTSVRLELFNDEGESQWQEQKTNEDIQKMIAMYRNQGLMNLLWREYRNLAMSPENAPFLPEHFKYYRPEDLKSGTVEYVILVDPAKTTNPRSCDTAIVVCGCDMVNNKIFVVDIVAAKLHPNEIYDNIMTLVLRWGARTVGVEYNGLNEFIEWPLKNALKRAGMFCDVIELKPRKGPSQYLLKNSNDNGKDARISAALVPLYRQGLIYHNPQHPVTVRLESQLCAFPSGRLKDIIDALSYVAEMLHIGERYMCNSRISMKKDVMPRDLITGFLDTASEDEALERLMAGDKNYGQNLKELVNA